MRKMTSKAAIGWPVRAGISALALSVLTLSDPTLAGAEEGLAVPPSGPTTSPVRARERLAIETTFADWMDDATAVTVRIASGDMRGSGTLVALDRVLTAAHVVGEMQQATIVLPEGRTVIGRVLRTDTVRDLALVAL